MVMVALGMFHASAFAVNCPTNPAPTVISAGTTYSTGCVLNTNGSTFTIDGASGGASAGAINVVPSTGITIQGNNISVVNNGSISAATGIFNRGTSTSIVNRGSITAGLVGINNDVPATITTLTNQQGASSTPLTYTGRLPTNYNIMIVSSSNYGQLSFPATSLVAIPPQKMTFDISSLVTPSSTIINQTLPGVLRIMNPVGGLPPAADVLINAILSNPNISQLPGIFTFASQNGYTYNIALEPALVNGEAWYDLTITACSVCTNGSSGSSGGSSGGATVSNVSAGTSVGLSALGANPVLAGGTLTLNSGDSSSVSIVVTSAGGTLQAPSSGTAILSGVFSGPGGLTFSSAAGKGGTGGMIVLSGANTYSGGTTVASGTLSVAGSSPTGTGDVVVASAGTLMGTGTIAGNAILNGVFKPGNSPGYLSVVQNVTLNASSTYQQDIAGTTQASSSTPVGATGYYSYLNVGRQLMINAGATLTPRLSNLFSANEAGFGSSIYVPVLGDTFRMITATGGITGRFTTLTQPAELGSGTQLIAFYNVNNSNSLDLATVPISYSTALASNTTNAKSVAGVLNQLLGVNKAGTATEAQDKLMFAAAGQTAASLPTFAQALAGEIHAASAATLAQAPQRLQQSVLARLGDYPMAPAQINPALNNAMLTGGISATNPSGLPTASMSSNPSVNPNTVNLTTAAMANGSAWGEIVYQRGDRASNSGGSGFNNNLYQVVLGIDAYTNAELGLKIGGGLALSNTTVSATNGNSTIQQGGLFVYGKMPVLQDYVIDGMVSLGLSSTNLSRNDPTGLTGAFSNKAVLGNDALVSLGISRPLEHTELRIAPYARVTYQYVGQAGYNEGSSAAALGIASFNGSAVRGVIGVAAGSLKQDPLKDDYTYRFNIAVGADTTGLLNPTLNTTIAGLASSVTTASAGSAFVQVGLYGTVKITDDVYAYASVAGEARSGQTLYGGSIGLRMVF